jgi:Domain of unknown function (DUF4188)
MAEAVQNGRVAAQIDGDFVVFLIGMRVNRLLAVGKWMPVAMAMPRMLKELMRQPELGLLSARAYVSGRVILTVQYWRSFEQLHAYAHSKDKEHLPAWTEFNRRVGGNGTVGIFHETYLVRAGEYESVFANMPRFGLGLAGVTVPAVGRMQSAKERLRARENQQQTED